MNSKREQVCMWFERHAFAIALVALCGQLFASAVLRSEDVSRVTGAPNLEASWHVLLTAQAWLDAPLSKHWFLPSVTLNGELEPGQPWGATIPTRTGQYVYTSFSSLGFLAPALFFRVFSLDPTLTHLALLNFLLQGAFSLGLLWFLTQLLRYLGVAAPLAVSAALTGASVAVLSREALLSHGIVYWSQCLFQPVLLASLALTFKIFTREDKTRIGVSSLMLSGCAFLGAWLEWTGFVLNAALLVVVWIQSRADTQLRRLMIPVFAATVCAALVIVLHIGLAAGFGPTFGALQSRFVVRSGAQTNTGSTELVRAYVDSYGAWLLLLIALLVATLVARLGPNAARRLSVEQMRVFKLMLALSCAPLLENVLLRQHATQFSFDRLKLIPSLAMLIAICFSCLSIKSRLLFSCALPLVMYQGYESYRRDLVGYASWPEIDRNNRALVEGLRLRNAHTCEVFASNTTVRGYSSLLVHQNVRENVMFASMPALLDTTHARCGVYLHGSQAFADLPAYQVAIVLHADRSVDDAFYSTDHNWEHGVARRDAAFFVPNLPELARAYTVGATVKLPDGTVRRIDRTVASDPFLNVYVSGGPIAAAMGPPSRFRLVGDDDDAFYLTDSHWIRGVARGHAGFFVANSGANRTEFAVDRLVKLSDGSQRRIIRTEANGVYLNVFVTGDSMHGDIVGPPNRFAVVDAAGSMSARRDR